MGNVKHGQFFRCNWHSFELQESKIALLSFLHNKGYMRVETKILIDNYPEEFPFCDMSTGENTVGTDVCVRARVPACVRVCVSSLLLHWFSPFLIFSVKV